MINSKHVNFYWGVLYSLDPPNAYLWGGPDPPTPPGIDAPVSDTPRASGLGATGSPRAPLPDPSLKKGTFSTGATAEWFKGGRQFWAKNAILGANFQFFPI